MGRDLMARLVFAILWDIARQISIDSGLGEPIGQHISCVNPGEIPDYSLEDFVSYGDQMNRQTCLDGVQTSLVDIASNNARASTYGPTGGYKLAFSSGSTMSSGI